MNFRDLVVLAYEENNFIVDDFLKCKDKYNLSVDTRAKIWFNDFWVNVPIGERRSDKYRTPQLVCSSADIKEGVVGIYNRREVKHLGNMVKHVLEFVQEYQ